VVTVSREQLRSELRRYGPPAAFLAAATLAVLLLRPVLHGGASPGRAATARTVRPQVAHTRPHLAPRRYYVLRAGDTLGAVALRYRTTVTRLFALNPGIEPRALHVGQRVRVK
jgi:LysM repeat protein